MFQAQVLRSRDPVFSCDAEVRITVKRGHAQRVDKEVLYDVFNLFMACSLDWKVRRS